MKKEELCNKAVRDVENIQSNLRALLNETNSVESILVLQLIERQALIQSDINSLCNAMYIDRITE